MVLDCGNPRSRQPLMYTLFSGPVKLRRNYSICKTSWLPSSRINCMILICTPLSQNTKFTTVVRTVLAVATKVMSLNQTNANTLVSVSRLNLAQRAILTRTVNVRITNEVHRMLSSALYSLPTQASPCQYGHSNQHRSQSALLPCQVYE